MSPNIMTQTSNWGYQLRLCKYTSDLIIARSSNIFWAPPMMGEMWVFIYWFVKCNLFRGRNYPNLRGLRVAITPSNPPPPFSIMPLFSLISIFYLHNFRVQCAAQWRGARRLGARGTRAGAGRPSWDQAHGGGMLSILDGWKFNHCLQQLERIEITESCK